MEKNLTDGNIGKQLIGFSVPMILGNLLQQLYNIADTLIVGKTIGASALSAVGSSYALMVLLASVILGLCMGSGVVFAQLFGAGKQNDMKTAIFNAFCLIFVICAVLNILSFLLLKKFIVWLNIPQEAALQTKEYLNVIFYGIFFIFIYNFVASILRSIGNTVVPLIFLAVSAITNIVLDLVFIVSFKMGVTGAALATVIAQGLSAVCITIYFFVKANSLCPSKQHCRVDKKLMLFVLNTSSLTAVQQSIMNFGILMVQGLVNSFGFAASAAFAVVVKIDAFAYMPAQDFGNAFATFTAQNFGAKKHERIHNGLMVAAKITTAFCALSSLIVFIFAKQFMLLFMDSSNTQIIDIGVKYLRTEGVFYVGIGILFLFYGLFRGMGRADVSIVLTVVSLGVRVALAYALASVSFIGLVGVWWAVPIGWALADIIGVTIYIKSRQKQLLK